MSAIAFIIGYRNENNEVGDLATLLFTDHGVNNLQLDDQVIENLLLGIKKANKKINLPPSVKQKMNQLVQDQHLTTLVEDVVRLSQ